MTSSVPRRSGTGAQRALKFFGVVVAAGIVINIVLLLLKYLLDVDSGLTSGVRVAVGWLILLSIIGAFVSGIVVLVQRTSKPPSAAPAAPMQRRGMAPGWYPDQQNPNLQRYFDGRNWTSGTAPRE